MSDHHEWVPIPDTRTPEERARIRGEMVQYVEGYILACNDVLEDLREIQAGGTPCTVTMGQIRDKVQKSLREARASLRMWKGTDDPGNTDPASH